VVCRQSAAQTRRKETGYTQEYARQRRRHQSEITRLETSAQALKHIHARVAFVTDLIPRSHSAIAEIHGEVERERERGNRLQTQLDEVTRQRDWLREDIAEMAQILLDRVKEPWRPWPPSVHNWVTNYLPETEPYPAEERWLPDGYADS
jgi:peptidoglycan hydrolase CwlO-like protein